MNFHGQQIRQYSTLLVLHSFKNVRDEKRLSVIWYKACFDVWTLQSDGRYRSPGSAWPPAASPTPTHVEAQKAGGSDLIGWHLLPVLPFLRVSRMNDRASAGGRRLPRYHRPRGLWGGAAAKSQRADGRSRAAQLCWRRGGKNVFTEEKKLSSAFDCWGVSTWKWASVELLFWMFVTAA